MPKCNEVISRIRNIQFYERYPDVKRSGLTYLATQNVEEAQAGDYSYFLYWWIVSWLFLRNPRPGHSSSSLIYDDSACIASLIRIIWTVFLIHTEDITWYRFATTMWS